MATREHIFGDQRPFAQCHASSLALLPGDRVLAAWFGGTREKHPDVGIWGAVREGGAWSAPVRFAKVRESPHWNPVLWAPSGEDVQLYFKVGDSISRWETWLATSRDGGRSFSPPHELVPGDRGGRGPVKNKPLRLADGTWLAPASLETRTSWDAFVDRSEDGGRSWKARPLVARGAVAGKGVIQPGLWGSSSGRVHMLLRSTCGRVCRSDSTDGGVTWSAVYPTELPHNNSGLDVVRLASGALVLVCNPVSGNWAARSPLSILVSEDDGASWPRRLDLESGEGEYSYPAVVAAGDNVAVTYTWRRERIAYWRGRVDEVPPA